MEKNNIERCPKCKSIFIQYNENAEECYCLEKKCSHRWPANFDFRNIRNSYLRNSVKHIPA